MKLKYPVIVHLLTAGLMLLSIVLSGLLAEALGKYKIDEWQFIGIVMFVLAVRYGYVWIL